ncbi:hydroxymethylbilane synthase [Candidatus Poriferisocius sp.]|uniref:hydroxymethylbilane synthase n=1 Tax=Candidatus Poriferisocius sp. TaxID=3101276 RepID=UPI003B022FE1
MLRAATRGSALARWQTAHIAELLGRAADVEPLLVATSGDRLADEPISAIGGKGVFVKEVQAAVLDGRADIAVHSAKDLPAATPEGLVIAAVPLRADPRDALVGCRLADLPEGALVATGSARRRVQLRGLRPDLRFAELRGNIGTRLAKAADFDAVVIAQAALERLGEHPPVVDVLSCETMVPQVGQGALAVECREDDHQVRALLAAIEDPTTRRAVDAERAFLAALGGDCTLPAGAHAHVEGDTLAMRAVLADGIDGRCHTVVGEGEDGEALGQELAGKLLQAVAR